MDTLQDKGRYGYGASGINPGGAMDMIAATVANYLVGNDRDEPVIELHYPASSFRFDQPALIAISGADLSAHGNDNIIPLNTPVIVSKGTELDFRKINKGSRACLAVRGGFHANKWLNSYSTNLKARAGGVNGRPLQKNDRLQLNIPHSFGNGLGVRSFSLPWQADVSSFYNKEPIIRITKGKEYDTLTDCSETILNGNTFSISLQSDRMGYRMNGSPLKQSESVEMISSVVSRGTIQLLPNGQIIILMADHQTTGGYPKLAHVISADLPSLAQMQPNTSIRFQLVSMEEAESLLLQQYHNLQQIKTACLFRLQEYAEFFT